MNGHIWEMDGVEKGMEDLLRSLLGSVVWKWVTVLLNIDGLVGPNWNGRMSEFCLNYVLLSECAKSTVIRGSLLECEEIVESDHKGLSIQFEWRVDVRRRK